MSQTKAQLLDGKSATIQFTAGSASTPAVSFTGDTNTGIYSPGADQVAISTNGANRIDINSGGVISHKIYDRWEQNDGSSVAGYIGNANLVLSSGSQADFALRSQANVVFAAGGGTERMRLDSAGRLGIGTSTPVSGAQLTVAGSALAVTGQNLDHSANSIRIGQEGSGAAQIRCYGPNTSTNGSLTFKMSRSDGTNSQDVVIDGSGKLGIGTSPAKKLDVYEGSAGNVEQYLRNTTINLLSKIEGTTSAQFGTETSHPLLLLTGNSERARIDSSGRLLVGTSSTSANSTVVLQGQSAGSTEHARLWVCKGSVTPSSGSVLGEVVFGDSSQNPYAIIAAYADATGGSGDYPGRLTFSTTADGASSPTERVRINSLGYFLASNTGSHANPNSALHQFRSNENVYRSFYVENTNNTSGSGTYNSVLGANCNNTSSYHFVGNTGATDRVLIYGNGNIQNSNGSYTTLSDVKLKENIVDASSQWDDLKTIKIRNWNFKEDTGHETHRQIGPIAQELETVCPGLVFETPDRDADGNETGEVTKGVNQSVLYMKAVKALQEAMERIEQLEAKVVALESKP